MKKLAYLLLFVSLYSYSQTKVKVDLRTPNSALFTHIYFLTPENYDLAKSATTVEGVKRSEAQFIAKRIKEIYDGNGLIIDFNKVPVDAKYIDTLNFGRRSLDQNKNRYAPFPVRLPEVYIEKRGSYWYYSEETIENLDKIYKDTFP